jgi:hypothetical protein
MELGVHQQADATVCNIRILAGHSWPIDIHRKPVPGFLFGLPFAMPLRLATTAERRALLVFVFGTLAYFASWLALM